MQLFFLYYNVRKLIYIFIIVQLICTVTPASSSMEETHNTLKFASRAKRVEIYASRNKVYYKFTISFITSSYYPHPIHEELLLVRSHGLSLMCSDLSVFSAFKYLQLRSIKLRERYSFLKETKFRVWMGRGWYLQRMKNNLNIDLLFPYKTLYD